MTIRSGWLSAKFQYYSRFYRTVNAREFKRATLLHCCHPVPRILQVFLCFLNFLFFKFPNFQNIQFLSKSLIFEDFALYLLSPFEIPESRFESFLKLELTFQWLETCPANPSPGTGRQNPPQLRKQLRFRVQSRFSAEKVTIWTSFEQFRLPER